MNFEKPHSVPAETLGNRETINARTERWSLGEARAKEILSQYDFESMDVREQISVLKDRLIEATYNNESFYTCEILAATVFDRELTLQQEEAEDLRPTNLAA